MNSVATANAATPHVQQQPTNPKPSTSAATAHLSSVDNMPVLLDFEGGNLTSDAGVLLLREVEQQIGIIKALADVIDEPRDARYVKHTIDELLIQRIAQIACGYEDAADCNTLRNDPVFKLFAGRLPESDPALASQPTMSRFENSISRSHLYRLATAFAARFVASYDKAPEIIVLDFDDTEDKVHGSQQQALFNGYFKDYCLMPLHVYEGLSGKLITTILRPGKRAKGPQMLAIVKRLIRYLRTCWPNTLIVFRGDGHFSYPEVMEWIDQQKNVMYAIGFSSNKRLKKLAENQERQALQIYKHKQAPVRLYHSFYYKASSWTTYRRVVAKIEVTDKGSNLRFVVTNMKNAKAKALYQQIYCDRGNAELYIKEHKLHLKSDRTSCHKFSANQFRLFLHSAAYVLIHELKTNILRHSEYATATIATIRLRLLKIGARVRQLKTRIRVELPASFPLKPTLLRSFQIFDALGKT